VKKKIKPVVLAVIMLCWSEGIKEGRREGGREGGRERGRQKPASIFSDDDGAVLVKPKKSF